MGHRIKITVIATGFNDVQSKANADAARSGKNVLPMGASSGSNLRMVPDEGLSERALEYRAALVKENLDEPAFRRRRLE